MSVSYTHLDVYKRQALNAVTVTLNGTAIGVLRTAPGVAAVEYLSLIHI